MDTIDYPTNRPIDGIYYTGYPLIETRCQNN